MENSTSLQIRGRGTITLPIDLRRKYGLDEGDVVTLTDLGNGSFLITPAVSQVGHSGDKVARAIAEKGVSADEILTALDEERERYYQEHYARD